MKPSENARAFALLLASREVGRFTYIWGGDGSEEGGFDCSGWVCHVLTEAARAWPSVYDGQRRTAASLMRHLIDERHEIGIRAVELLRPGCLVFYRDASLRVYHVAMHAVTVPDVETASGKLPVGPVAFEAGGAGSDAVSPRAALLRSAGIRLSASDHHGGAADWVAFDPFRHLDRPEE